jgi:hypothetical protein
MQFWKVTLLAHVAKDYACAGVLCVSERVDLNAEIGPI